MKKRYKVTALFEDGTSQCLVVGNFSSPTNAWCAAMRNLTPEGVARVQHYNVEEISK
ncbi:hypothetical protein [Bacillus phage SPO1L3]|nr:hypothetical protein [Bacillus phage SPO1L3]WIT26758.1 hypothetical protein [Bacillus phage SPO1L5]